MQKQTQRAALARQKDRGTTLRGWLQERGAAAQERLRERRKATEEAKAARAEKYGKPERPVEYVHEHTGRIHQPYVNPARDKKPGARLRVDLATAPVPGVATGKPHRVRLRQLRAERLEVAIARVARTEKHLSPESRTPAATVKRWTR